MRFDKRIQGQSQLDYLWANYGNLNVSSTLTTSPDDTLLTQKAIQQFIGNGISDIKVTTRDNTNYLDLYNSSGQIIKSQILPSGIAIKSFGARIITQADIDKGSELTLGTPVYSIVLTNGNEYLAPTTSYVGEATSSIALHILNDAISAELKINNRASIVSISNTDDGVSADLNLSTDSGISFKKGTDGYEGGVVLENSDKFIKFCLVSSAGYTNLVNNNEINDTTMYLISDKDYFYFGKHKMMGSGISLDDYYTKEELDNIIDNKITNIIDIKLEQTLNWNNIQ